MERRYIRVQTKGNFGTNIYRKLNSRYLWIQIHHNIFETNLFFQEKINFKIGFGQYYLNLTPHKVIPVYTVYVWLLLNWKFQFLMNRIRTVVFIFLFCSAWSKLYTIIGLSHHHHTTTHRTQTFWHVPDIVGDWNSVYSIRITQINNLLRKNKHTPQ